MSCPAHRSNIPRLRAALLGCLVLTLAGCSSNANPFNWFRPDPVIIRSEDAGPEPEVNPLIPQRRGSFFRNEQAAIYQGSLIAEVTDLQVETVRGGVVVRASGVATSLGAFDVRLIPVPSESESTLRLEFRAVQAASTAGLGTEAARGVTVAFSLTDQSLSFVRTIEVVAAQNVRSVRR